MDNCDYEFEDTRFYDNEVHTILYIYGNKEGKDNAKMLLENIGKKGMSVGNGFELFFNNLVFHEDGQNIWTKINVDNLIPQVYDDLLKLPNVDNVVWAIYADNFTNLLTNDIENVILSRYSLFGIPNDQIPEIYDPVSEDYYYPDLYELAHFKENQSD